MITCNKKRKKQIFYQLNALEGVDGDGCSSKVGSQEDQDDDGVEDKHDPVDGLGKQVPTRCHRDVHRGGVRLVVDQVPLGVVGSNLRQKELALVVAAAYWSDVQLLINLFYVIT